MAEVTMSLEEYLHLVKHSDPNTVGELFSMPGAPKVSRSKKPKRVGKKDPKMARALKKANDMGRKKDKSFRKGWNQRKIMKKAHQLRKRM